MTRKNLFKKALLTVVAATTLVLSAGVKANAADVPTPDVSVIDIVDQNGNTICQMNNYFTDSWYCEEAGEFPYQIYMELSTGEAIFSVNYTGCPLDPAVLYNDYLGVSAFANIYLGKYTSAFGTGYVTSYVEMFNSLSDGKYIDWDFEYYIPYNDGVLQFSYNGFYDRVYFEDSFDVGEHYQSVDLKKEYLYDKESLLDFAACINAVAVK